MKNLAFYRLFRWKMILLTNCHCITCTFLLKGFGECNFWTCSGVFFLSTVITSSIRSVERYVSCRSQTKDLLKRQPGHAETKGLQTTAIVYSTTWSRHSASFSSRLKCPSCFLYAKLFLVRVTSYWFPNSYPGLPSDIPSISLSKRQRQERHSTRRGAWTTNSSQPAEGVMRTLAWSNAIQNSVHVTKWADRQHPEG